MRPSNKTSRLSGHGLCRSHTFINTIPVSLYEKLLAALDSWEEVKKQGPQSFAALSGIISDTGAEPRSRTGVGGDTWATADWGKSSAIERVKVLPDIAANNPHRGAARSEFARASAA